jgi:hypothetical protein
MHPLQEELSQTPASAINKAAAHILPLNEQALFVAFSLCAAKLSNMHGRSKEDLNLLLGAATEDGTLQRMAAEESPLDFVEYLADLDKEQLFIALTFCAAKLAIRHEIPLSGLIEVVQTATTAKDAAIVAAFGK